MVLPGLLSATYLSFSGPTTWTLELCFKKSEKWISGHSPVWREQINKSMNAFEHQLCLSSRTLIPGVLAGPLSLVLFHQHPPCTYCPGCHPCNDPRIAFRRLFSGPWLHVKALIAPGLSTEQLQNAAPMRHLTAYLCVLWSLLIQEVSSRHSSFPPLQPLLCKGWKEAILEKPGWQILGAMSVQPLQQRR